MADRSRREKKSKLDKLAEYKRVREGGDRSWKDEDVKVYDEVTEDQYKTIVKGRLQRDDFVVDDGVDGYMDNGMDEWEGRMCSDDEYDKRRTVNKKKGRDDGRKSKTKPKAPPPQVVAPSMSAYRPVVSAEQEADFMSSILGAMDALPSTSTTKSRKRKSPEYELEPGSSSPPYDLLREMSYEDADMQFDISWDGDASGIPSSDDIYTSPKKRAKTGGGGLTPAIERMSQMGVHSETDEFDTSFDDIDMDAFMDVDGDDLADTAPKTKWRPAKGAHSPKKLDRLFGSEPTKPIGSLLITNKEKSAPAWLSVYDSLSVTREDSLGPLSSNTSFKSSKISALEPDGSLRFFWLDYLEHEGRIYFIGKLIDKTSGAWISCCVAVEGIQRNLFILPRERQVEEIDGDLCETDIVPTQDDVYDDFDRVRKRFSIKAWKGRFVKRKYAFGEPGVPREEREWLKVLYGFNEPQIPSNATGPNIARIFGTNTSAFELLVLKRKIMGPCWLKVMKPELNNKGVSWCKLEATVSNPKDINPFSEADPEAPKDMPPLTVMSLTVRTIVNHQENKREIVCTTARIWHNIQIDDPTPPEQQPCNVHTFVRPLDRFPPNFEARAKENAKGLISPMMNERMLLTSLLVTIHKADPDVIVGHEFLGVSLDVFLTRMHELKVEHWSRIGRFRREKWPNIGKQGTNIKFLNGRLLCDLASDGAKGMIASTTWSLTEMCKTHLKFERQDIDPDDTVSYLDGGVSSPDPLLTFVRHCELDAHYQMAIAARVQMLPLTKQLTNLAGNSWNKTLNGGRAERNEYILLHEFHRLKYICPDKLWGKKAPIATVVKVPQDDDPEAPQPTKAKRDKYQGGLVFDPNTGLWDKFILVMDFNSLYPSIIQEYNIDFTTIDRVEDEHTIPEPPSPDVPQGVLPRLIATLVNRRRQVKALMKDKTASPAKLLQYDIKQMALKLTANSMYGCLGFEYSRFYAKPLAALTTFKGREILMHARELAESLQFEVVYGDTDSVFINSNVTELSEALKIAAEFKKAVNDCYKLLEIDLDSVFKRLLLLQKKKYAAIKIEDGTRTSTEVKGLDMKRREYCALSKTVSQYVLDQILFGESTETVVENIHDYLTTIGQDIRDCKIKLDEFIIFKRLGKNPNEYPDAKNQPHVQVAERMQSRGGSARAGDVIPYVFCVAEGEDAAKSVQADRAKHPDEVRKADAELQIDFEYYLSQQILPPIERLCDPIEGTDRARLAECLGLDPSRYRNSVSGGYERAFASLDSQISDKERFKDADPFIVQCRHCQAQLAFAPIMDRVSSILLPSGPTCPSCRNMLRTPSLQMQLEVQIRGHIARYYEGWTVCDDATCSNRTRMMSVYGRRCLRSGCHGTVAFEYSDAQLYNQLRFYSYLFDVEKATKAVKGTTKHDEVVALTGLNMVFLQTMKDTVEKYLDNSGRRWVDLRGLFSFMNI